MELRETILEGTIQAFNKKGLKFTMDDIAALLGISKKTIYTVFQDKNTLVSEMVDYCFDSIKESEQKVLSDTSLDTVVRPIQIPILKTMMEATLEQFFQRDILITNQISYNEALEEVVNILVDGITR